MKARHFLKQIDHDRIVAAIREAESHSSGQIRVHVSHKEVEDPLKTAAQLFDKMRMYRTTHRNAVLIFVAPESQKYAIIGDKNVHAKCGDGFWQSVAAEMGRLFAEHKFTDAIVHGISAAGKLLASHFPNRPTDRNELPDAVTED